MLFYPEKNIGTEHTEITEETGSRLCDLCGLHFFIRFIFKRYVRWLLKF